MQTLANWWEEFLNYFNKGYTSAVVEGSTMRFGAQYAGLLDTLSLKISSSMSWLSMETYPAPSHKSDENQEGFVS
ncbi:MAG: hypothetical protein Fur0022_00080 [Anaerolineales bacterium]